MKSIAVVGAGWAGVAAALTLARAGANVSVFESARIAGGRARRVLRDGRIVDNGQHLLLGAYERTTALIRSVHSESVAPVLALPLTLQSAPKTVPALHLQTPKLSEPWNLLMGLLAANGLHATEKIAAIAWAIRTLHGKRIDPTKTVAALVDDQPIIVRRLLWEPLCVAALNTPPENASAEVFVEVLRRTFSREKNASQLLIPASDLTAILPEPALAEVEARGGRIFLGKSASLVTNTDIGVAIAFSSGSENFDAAILAVAPQHVSRILSREHAAEHVARSLDTISFEPITTIYFEFPHVHPSPDQGSPMLMLDGDPGQWIFWSRLQDGRWRAAVIISAHQRSGDKDALVASALKQLAHNYQLPVPVWHFVITEKQATYACTPPQTTLLKTLPSRIGRIHFAGDWCYPKLPATIEAAVISGEFAAHAALEDSRDGR